MRCILKTSTALLLVKLVHTLAWAFFAGSIVALPVCSYFNRFALAMLLIAFVIFEIIVLGFNRFACPLTKVAARYTNERKDNFDIYLPLWLARHNKQIFGVLFFAGLIYTAAKWLLRSAGT